VTPLLRVEAVLRRYEPVFNLFKEECFVGGCFLVFSQFL
jgi:hypothetical protein